MEKDGWVYGDTFMQCHLGGVEANLGMVLALAVMSLVSEIFENELGSG